nr:Uncharacterised protein [Klebsiella pneumoniae]
MLDEVASVPGTDGVLLTLMIFLPALTPLANAFSR